MSGISPATRIGRAVHQIDVYAVCRGAFRRKRVIALSVKFDSRHPSKLRLQKLETLGFESGLHFTLMRVSPDCSEVLAESESQTPELGQKIQNHLSVIHSSPPEWELPFTSQYYDDNEQNTLECTKKSHNCQEREY
jgi:hypothetical protein